MRGTATRLRAIGWWDPDDTLQMRISALPDWRYSMLIAIHELVEALLWEVYGKSLELLTDVLPRGARIAVLFNPRHESMPCT